MNTSLQILCLAVGFSIATVCVAAAAAPDRAAIERATGVAATVENDGVVRIGWVRDDVEVTVDGAPLPAAAGLGSWAGFKSTPDGDVIVMGDTVVFEDEITPAMDAAFANGLAVTALHNHFIADRPPVYFMHIGGRAPDALPLAAGVAAIWNAIKQVRAQQPVPRARLAGDAVAARGPIDTAALAEILGASGRDAGGAVKFAFPRKARADGTTVSGTMGLASWAAFVGNDDYASVDGDFAMQANEVQAVMHALRAANIHIVALHNHIIGEEPAYYFLHFWGKGDARALARGLRSALDRQ